MKKIITILSCLIFIIPINLKAVNVQGATISGPNEITIGDEYILNVYPSFNGFNPGYDNKIGYLLVYIEIIYNEDVMSLQNASIPHFEVDFTSDEGNYGKGHRIIIAAFEDENSSNLCAYDSLYCGDVSLELKFFAKLTKETSTDIEIRNITIGYLDFTNVTKEEIEQLDENQVAEFVFKNLKSTYKDVQQTKTIKIKNNNSDTQIKEPEPTVPFHSNSGLINSNNINIPKVDNSEVTKPAQTKSNNSNLSKLEIQNYQIDFNKDKKEYEITVGASVNKIIVTAETEDSKSIARVKGADDLNANGNKVTIEVLAEDNSSSTYTINVTHKEELKTEQNKTNDKKENKINVDKKILKLLLGILSGIILIIIIIFLSTINKRRKLNKLFEEL